MALILQYISDFQYYMDKYGGKSYYEVLTLLNEIVSGITPKYSLSSCCIIILNVLSTVHYYEPFNKKYTLHLL